MRDVSWRLNKDCNILTPTLLAIAAFLSLSPELLKRGPGGPASAGSGSHSTDCNNWLQTLISNWSQRPVAPGYIIVCHPPAFCERHIWTQFNPPTVNVIPWYLRPDVPVIYTVAFLTWQMGRVGGQYATIRNSYLNHIIIVTPCDSLAPVLAVDLSLESPGLFPVFWLILIML